MGSSCTVHNDVVPFNMNFRQITDTHVESNVFEIFKLRSSTLALINCWVQFCVQKTKCSPRHCTETQLRDNHQSSRTHGIHAANALMHNLMDHDDTRFAHGETVLYRDAGVRIIVEDPYGIQAAKSVKTENSVPNTIGMERI